MPWPKLKKSKGTETAQKDAGGKEGNRFHRVRELVRLPSRTPPPSPSPQIAANSHSTYSSEPVSAPEIVISAVPAQDESGDTNTSDLPPFSVDGTTLQNLQEWQKSHPETALTKVLEKAVVVLESKPLQFALEAIPPEPFPVGSVVKSLVTLLAFGFKSTSRKKDAVEFALQVAQDVGAMADAFGSAPRVGDELRTQCFDDLKPFCDIVNNVCQWAYKQAKSWMASSAEKELTEFRRMLQDARQQFLAISTIRMMREISSISASIVQLLEYHARESRLKLLEERFGTRLARQFQYNDQDKDMCHPMTRNEILSDLDRRLHELSDKGRSIWILGKAGVGKSSIAITTARCLLDQRPLLSEDAEDGLPRREPPDLVAHYFFNHKSDSNNIDRLFPTLAMQLAKHSPAAAHLISQAINERRAIVDRFSKEQGELLVIRPLSYLAAVSPSRLFIVLIDGLDEVQPSRSHGPTLQSLYIKCTTVLCQLSDNLPANVRFILLSRPQSEILASIPPHIDRLTLDTELSRPDVRRFFESELPDVGKQTLHPEFPTPQQLEDLCTYADGHLGWARQTRDWFSRRLHTRQIVDLDEEIRRLGQLTHGDLYDLYSHLLTTILPSHHREREEYLTGLQRVLRCLVALREPQTIDTICKLTQADDRFHVWMCLKDLSGLYAQGSSEVDDQTIPLPHKSFFDFLLSSSGHPEFHVNLAQAHAEAAVACFRIVSSGDLSFNFGHFIHFITPPQFKMEMEAARSRIADYIHYACVALFYHAGRCDASLELECKRFVSASILSWLEVVLLVRPQVPFNSTIFMEDIKSFVDKQEDSPVRRVLKFVNIFGFLTWSRHPQAIYNGWIPFMPHALRKLIPSSSIDSTSSCDDRDWLVSFSNPLDTRMQLGVVTYCAISPDGRRLAFGSGGRVSIHSVSSTTPDRVLWEPSAESLSLDPEWRKSWLCFASDSRSLVIITVSGVFAEVWLIDATSGAERTRWKSCLCPDGHPIDSITIVSVSPKGTYLAFSFYTRSERNESKSWISVFSHGRNMWALPDVIGNSFFLSDDWILFTKDSGMHVIDSETGTSKTSLRDFDRVTSVMTLPIGTLIFGDKSGRPHPQPASLIRILEHGLGEQEHPPPLVEEQTTLTPSSDVIYSSAFSHAENLLALGTLDGSIEFWRCDEGFREWTYVTALFGHLRPTHSLVFCPGGKRLISYSSFHNVLIWDISPIVDGKQWDTARFKGDCIEGSWYQDGIALGGWNLLNGKPEPFLYKYPFELPGGVEPLDWKFDEDNHDVEIAKEDEVTRL